MACKLRTLLLLETALQIEIIRSSTYILVVSYLETGSASRFVMYLCENGVFYRRIYLIFFLVMES